MTVIARFHQRLTDAVPEWPLALLLVIQVLVLEPAREVEAPAAVEAPVQATGATP